MGGVNTRFESFEFFLYICGGKCVFPISLIPLNINYVQLFNIIPKWKKEY